MHSENWDDLRYVLAVAEAGTVSGAAREMGVNHATVLRRISAFEGRLGVPIFNRTAQGYSIRTDRLKVIEAARDAAQALERVGQMAQGRTAPLTGCVKVTSTDTLCLKILPEILSDFQSGQHGIRVNILCSNDDLDFARLDADLSVRPAPRLGEGMAGEIGARLGFGIYTAPDAPERWLGVSGRLQRSPAGSFLKHHVTKDLICGAADSFPVLREMAAGGAGRVFLPCILGDTDPRLIRLPNPDGPISTPLWVAGHEELIDVPRIAAVRKVLLRGLSARAEALEGFSG